MAGFISLGGAGVALVLRPINRRLDGHSKQLAQVGSWKLRTAQAMSSAITLLDQVEKRVTRIENRDDAKLYRNLLATRLAQRMLYRM